MSVTNFLLDSALEYKRIARCRIRDSANQAGALNEFGGRSRGRDCWALRS